MKRLKMTTLTPVCVLALLGVILTAGPAAADQIFCATDQQFPNCAVPNQAIVGVAGFSQYLQYAVTATGSVYSQGQVWAGMNARPLSAPIVGIATVTISYSNSYYYSNPYWLVARDGGVFAFPGSRPSAGPPLFFGSMAGKYLNSPVVGIAATPDGRGYWLVSADGGVFSFGDAQFYESMGGNHLNSPVVGIAATADGGGYWLVAADGGVFSFGDAQFYGSMAGTQLDAPVVGIAATGSGGYVLAGADGGIFSFGDAIFAGSAQGVITAPVVGVSIVNQYVYQGPYQPATFYGFASVTTSSGVTVLPNS